MDPFLRELDLVGQGRIEKGARKSKGKVAPAIGPATDIYSRGVMLFEMLTGNPPGRGSLGIVMGQIVAAPVPPVREFLPKVDLRLDAICCKAMAKDPAACFPKLNDPTAKVAVQVDGERINVSGLDKPLTLTVGEQDLTVKGPDFETETKTFRVKNAIWYAAQQLPLWSAAIPLPLLHLSFFPAKHRGLPRAWGFST